MYRFSDNEYGSYCVPAASLHRPAAAAILAHRVHEPATLEFMTAACGAGDVVHAGAYFGDFLPALSAAIGATSTVWAFEPNPENYRCAQITRRINGLANVRLANVGLSDRNAQVHMRVMDERGRSLGGGSQIVDRDRSEASGTTAVEVVPLDEVVGRERTVSIIQLDLEGHEVKALQGAMTTILRCSPVLILEVLPQSNLTQSRWFAEHILGAGYRRFGEFHGNVVFQKF